jgi:anti-sigma B factor antagonist
MSSVATLRAAIEAAVESGARELWLDLSPTAFMDSSGLHLVLESEQSMRTLARRMAIVCPAGVVRRLFEVAGVTEALPLYDDLAAAHRDA